VTIAGLRAGIAFQWATPVCVGLPGCDDLALFTINNGKLPEFGENKIFAHKAFEYQKHQKQQSSQHFD
jgi:hypothetical protein